MDFIKNKKMVGLEIMPTKSIEFEKKSILLDNGMIKSSLKVRDVLVDLDDQELKELEVKLNSENNIIFNPRFNLNSLDLYIEND
jgi:hypothetical protein